MNAYSGEYATIALEQPASMPSALLAHGRWKKEVSDAGVVWSLLTEADLQKLASHKKTLTELVRERYRVSSQEADRQITSFIQDHQAFSL